MAPKIAGSSLLGVRKFPRFAQTVEGCWLSVGTVSYSPAPLHSSHQRPLKAGIVNAYSYWMAGQIHLLIKNDAAPNELRVDTGMVALKARSRRLGVGSHGGT